jgi:hypothetical protein
LVAHLIEIDQWVQRAPKTFNGLWVDRRINQKIKFSYDLHLDRHHGSNRDSIIDIVRRAFLSPVHCVAGMDLDSRALLFDPITRRFLCSKRFINAWIHKVNTVGAGRKTNQLLGRLVRETGFLIRFDPDGITAYPEFDAFGKEIVRVVDKLTQNCARLTEVTKNATRGIARYTRARSTDPLDKLLTEALDLRESASTYRDTLLNGLNRRQLMAYLHASTDRTSDMSNLIRRDRDEDIRDASRSIDCTELRAFMRFQHDEYLMSSEIDGITQTKFICEDGLFYTICDEVKLPVHEVQQSEREINTRHRYSEDPLLIDVANAATRYTTLILGTKVVTVEQKYRPGNDSDDDDFFSGRREPRTYTKLCSATLEFPFREDPNLLCMQIDVPGKQFVNINEDDYTVCKSADFWDLGDAKNPCFRSATPSIKDLTSAAKSKKICADIQMLLEEKEKAQRAQHLAELKQDAKRRVQRLLLEYSERKRFSNWEHIGVDTLTEWAGDYKKALLYAEYVTGVTGTDPTPTPYSEYPFKYTFNLGEFGLEHLGQPFVDMFLKHVREVHDMDNTGYRNKATFALHKFFKEEQSRLDGVEKNELDVMVTKE